MKLLLHLDVGADFSMDIEIVDDRGIESPKVLEVD